MRRHRFLLRYSLRKLLYLPVGLLLLSLLSFAINRMTAADAVRQRMDAQGRRVSVDDLLTYERDYRTVAAGMGEDLPSFYFTVTNAALPDTLHRVVIASRRATLRELALTYGNWERVQEYFRALLAARNSEVRELRLAARRLLQRPDESFTRSEISQLATVPAASHLRKSYREMVEGRDLSRLLAPRLYWNGFDNKYHRYLSNLLRGELGISQDHRPVAENIAGALPLTIILNGLALLMVYLLAVPLGLYMARYRGSRFDRLATVVTFLAFGIPSFWVATLLANYFTSPAYGMKLFDVMGLGSPPPDAGYFERLKTYSSHLILPVFCLVYPSLAYVSRHLRSAAITELDKPYVRTALMKGLTASQVLWRHVFRNAAFPLVTLFGGLLPGLLAGSVLVEQIFNLPGTGRLLFNAAISRDWPTLTALVLLNGMLTITGLVLADLGYALIDPRVQLGKRPLK